MTKSFRDRNPVTLGLAGAVVVALLLVGSLELAKLSTAGEAEYHARLSRAGALTPGEDVDVAGVKVGTVKGLTLVPSRSGTYVRLDFFLDHHVPMGSRTSLQVKVLSPLGQEYVQLVPAGSGQLAPGATIPLSRTAVTPTLVDTLGRLGSTVGAIDTAQMSKALQVINSDLGGIAPGATKAVLSGLGRLSTVIDERQQELGQLVSAASQVMATVDAHKTQVLALVGQSNLILQVVEQRQTELAALLDSTTSLASHLSSIMTSKSADLATLLRELNTVSGVLAANSKNLDQIVPLAAGLAKYGANASGSGRYFDAEVPLAMLDDSDIQACSLPGAFKAGLDGESCQLDNKGNP